jgi:hypothetical protein
VLLCCRITLSYDLFVGTVDINSCAELTAATIQATKEAYITTAQLAASRRTPAATVDASSVALFCVDSSGTVGPLRRLLQNSGVPPTVGLRASIKITVVQGTEIAVLQDLIGLTGLFINEALANGMPPTSRAPARGPALNHAPKSAAACPPPTPPFTPLAVRDCKSASSSGKDPVRAH